MCLAAEVEQASPPADMSNGQNSLNGIPGVLGFLQRHVMSSDLDSHVELSVNVGTSMDFFMGMTHTEVSGLVP